MSSRHLPLEVFFEVSTRRRPLSQPGTHWKDYMSYLAWECLRIPQEELEDVAGEEDFGSPAASADKDGWTDKTTLSL